jgi:FixJ family two-component response regulator
MDRTRTFIAVLDDEPQFCKALGRLLKTHGFEVEMFTLGEELLAACASRLPDCLLLDLHMPHINGFEVLERLAALRLRVPVVVITGHDQPGNADRVRALGACAYLLKPVNDQTVLDAIKFALDRESPENKAYGNDQTDESMNTNESRPLVAVVADEECFRTVMTHLPYNTRPERGNHRDHRGRMDVITQVCTEFQMNLTAASISARSGFARLTYAVSRVFTSADSAV